MPGSWFLARVAYFPNSMREFALESVKSAIRAKPLASHLHTLGLLDDWACSLLMNNWLRFLGVLDTRYALKKTSRSAIKSIDRFLCSWLMDIWVAWNPSIRISANKPKFHKPGECDKHPDSWSRTETDRKLLKLNTNLCSLITLQRLSSLHQRLELHQTA